MSSAFFRVVLTSLARCPNCSPALRISLARSPPFRVPGTGIPSTLRGRRWRRSTSMPAAAPSAAVAAGTTTFLAALATPLAALLPTSLARSVRLPLREAAAREREAAARERDPAARERDDARACGRDAARDREFRLLEAGRPPELPVRRDACLRPDEDCLDELPLELRPEAARLVS